MAAARGTRDQPDAEQRHRRGEDPAHLRRVQQHCRHAHIHRHLVAVTRGCRFSRCAACQSRSYQRQHVRVASSGGGKLAGHDPIYQRQCAICCSGPSPGGGLNVAVPVKPRGVFAGQLPAMPRAMCRIATASWVISYRTRYLPTRSRRRSGDPYGNDPAGRGRRPAGRSRLGPRLCPAGRRGIRPPG